MIKCHRAAALVGLIFLVLACMRLCHAQQALELIENAAAFDGRSVSIEGEVIGDVMVRKDGAWLNVNDGTNAIGVWAAGDLAKDVTITGGYAAKVIGSLSQERSTAPVPCMEGISISMQRRSRRSSREGVSSNR